MGLVKGAVAQGLLCLVLTTTGTQSLLADDAGSDSETIPPTPVEITEPVVIPDPEPTTSPESTGLQAGPEPNTETKVESVSSFDILDQQVMPGALQQFNWQLESAMAGLAVPTPVLVAHGSSPGPTMCLFAAVHGDELNGVEVVRRIMFDLKLEKLVGTVVGVPIANVFGFIRSSRYLPDRRDLNRSFPGSVSGSMASRFAHALFTQVVLRCHVLVDIHTGSFFRVNLPQLRADLTLPDVLELSRKFGDIAVLHSKGPTGSLRRAATDVGIPTVTLEAGGPSRFQEEAVEAGVEAIEVLLGELGMIRRPRWRNNPQPVFYDSTWVRAETGGILLVDVELGEKVDKGQPLGTVTDPIENRQQVLKAPFRGRILGMSLNRVVMPGFAAFHVGRAADELEAMESAVQEESKPDPEEVHSEQVIESAEMEDALLELAPADSVEPAESETPPEDDEGPGDPDG
ncbi:MAG: succinylglutamate desuccinylase/aspartoacylase family protein [Xanthomonadales bacterium]|nr:succinylglutamate desuccinylase/aspartoacylase family protein [Xanthomonadales bacterium]